MADTTKRSEIHDNGAYLPELPPPYEERTRSTNNVSPMVHPVGPKPFNTICPSCNHEILTRVETEVTYRTHLLALALCCLECYICACIPYCTDYFKNKNHKCPNCNVYLGTYKN